MGDRAHHISTFLDTFAGAMDNLSRIYGRRKEYEKALPLLEQVMPIYRTMEIYDHNFTYQRVYATKLMIECLKELGKKNLAILYEFESKLLNLVVLEAREKEAYSC